MNLLAGAVADRLGRRRLLLLGWFASLPVRAILAWTPDGSAVVAAFMLLGVGQALT